MDLEKKRKEVELMKIRAATVELEFKMMERQQDIERIEGHIKLQKERQKELEKELKGDK